MHITIYRDHELVARREQHGWRVRITDTDRKTALHAHPFAAFAEARAQIDSFLNRGARQPIWPGVADGHRGRGILPELRQLPAWFRSALTGGARRA
jgi:hypothetical protein